MKLLLCRECNDIFNLRMEEKKCGCGKTSGRYTDEVNAEYRGPAVPLGFTNSSLAGAVRRRTRFGPGKTFVAFVIERVCPTFVKLKESK